MKKILGLLLIAIAFTACDKNEDYDELPEPIVMFITKYWPNPVIEGYSHPSENEYSFTIKNGPSFEFNGNYSWTEVDGNGLPLPQIFLYDEMPQALYEYLESGSYLNQVFEVERNSVYYKLELLTVDLYYDIATATVRGEQ